MPRARLSDYLTTLSEGLPLGGADDSSGTGGGVCSGGSGASTGSKCRPCPFSRAKIAATRSTGMDISCETPPKRAENWIQSLSIVRFQVAPTLTFSTIWPSLTKPGGTRKHTTTTTNNNKKKPETTHQTNKTRNRDG